MRFERYVEALGLALGHADRILPARRDCAGLLLPGEHKSIEPMAAQVEPGRVQATRQSLHHLIAKADWSDAAVLGVVRSGVLPLIEQHGPIQAWIIDDTGFPKRGKHSVGVARQYCGQLGKQGNCQVAVSLSVANDHASLPVAWRLYLPQAWAEDADRRAKAGVPEYLPFATKPQIALEQIRAAQASGIPPGIVLADAGYGVDTDFRDGIGALSLAYVVGIQSPPASGRPVRRRCQSSRGAGAAARPLVSAAAPSTSPSPPGTSPRGCPRRPGAGRPGGRAPMHHLLPALPPCVFAPPTATTRPPCHDRRNGARSNGRPGKPSPPSSGSPPCPPPPAAPPWSATP